jgi:hypothetical protein
LSINNRFFDNCQESIVSVIKL